MKELLPPKLDYVFKKLFTADTDILIDLLNTVLELPEKRQITSAAVKNPTTLPEEINEKYIILDILAIDNSGHQYNFLTTHTKRETRQCKPITRLRLFRKRFRFWKV